jgi:hypothetical protein
MRLQGLEKLSKKNTIENVKIDNEAIMKIKNCAVCTQGKQTRMKFTSSESRSGSILELIHSDLMGPMETMSFEKKRYVL